MGSYFGAALCALEGSGDGVALLVGVPMFYGDGTGGRVEVCMVLPQVWTTSTAPWCSARPHPNKATANQPQSNQPLSELHPHPYPHTHPILTPIPSLPLPEGSKFCAFQFPGACMGCLQVN